MTPGARIEAAIEISTELNTQTTKLEKLTRSYFQHRRYAGSKDRRAIIDYVYGFIRRQSRLNWWIERVKMSLAPSARLRAIVDLVLTDQNHLKDIQKLFNGEKYCPIKLSPSEIKLIEYVSGHQSINHLEMPECIRLEYPDWLDASLKRRFGERLNQEMISLNEPAPMDIRVNTMKSTFEEVFSSLINNQYNVNPTPFSPLSIRVNGRANITKMHPYHCGWFEIQDEGSQLVSLLTDARAGMTVVDFCAGAGGKTLALAASMTQNGVIEGCLSACDISRTRLERTKSRAERAGAESIKIHNLISEDDPWIYEHERTVDRVLLDVPCSGTGTWRRRPMDKWRLTPLNYKENLETQRRILKSAQRLVKSGGRLVYATCSVLAEENEDQVDWFVSNMPGFEVVDVGLLWRDHIGDQPPVSGPYLHLTPASTQTDGFFCAVLQNKGN